MSSFTSRKLASVQAIKELRPIEGKDRIELATVLGWHVIVQKGLYQVGDLCIYCEPDSVMPEKPEFEFLRPRKFRIKAMKMAGVISEGICFPVDMVHESKRKEGTDVTDILGVKHVDEVDPPPVIIKEASINKSYLRLLMKNPITRPIGNIILKRNAKARRNAERFPSFISKTDEVRVQTIPHILERERTLVCREKLDGRSMTAFVVKKKHWLAGILPFLPPKYEFGVCSRNRRLTKGSVDGPLYIDVAEKYKLEDALKAMCQHLDWVVIQGELIGQGVQGNNYQLDDRQFYAFNLITPSMTIPCTVAETITRAYDIPWVPMLPPVTLPKTVEEMLEIATGPSLLNPKVLREGVVCRQYSDGVSFKAVSPEYLLGHQEVE